MYSQQYTDIINKAPSRPDRASYFIRWIKRHPEQVNSTDLHDLYKFAIYQNNEQLFNLLHQFNYDFSKLPPNSVRYLLLSATEQLQNPYFWEYIYSHGGDPFYVDPKENYNSFQNAMLAENYYVMCRILELYPDSPIPVDSEEIKRMAFATGNLYNGMPGHLLRSIAIRLKKWGYRLPFHRSFVADFGSFDSDSEMEYHKPEYDDIY